MAEIDRVVPNLLSGSRYVVKVRAFNNLGVASDWSDSFVFQTIGDQTIPSVPTNVIANYSSTALILTWDAPTTNTDGSTLIDLKGYKVTLTANSITKTYEIAGARGFFILDVDQNKRDFITVQSAFQITVKAVDVNGNESAAVSLYDQNDPPSNPTVAPILTPDFTSITITMTPPTGLLDFGGFYLEHSLTGTGSWSLISDQIGDTYYHTVNDTVTHYYRYKVRDRFGQLSSGYSPIAQASCMTSITDISDITIPDGYLTDDMIGSVNVSKVRTGTIQTYAGNATIFTINAGGYIQSVGYSASGSPQGYRLQNDKLIFQNGAIDIVGQAGAIYLDSTSFRAVYSSQTRMFIDSTGVYIGGSNSSNANLIVDTSGNTTFQAAGGTYTFKIDTSATGSNRYLSLYPSGSPSTPSFYLTADGTGYFGKGTIGLQGGGGGFNVDSNGNMWQGTAASYAAATQFKVSNTGSISAPSGTFGGALSAATGTFAGSLSAASGSFSGSITSTSGTIGGWTIGSSTLSGGGVTLNASGAISGGTITGSLVRSASSGQRVELQNGGTTGTVYFYSGLSAETTPAQLVNFSGYTIGGSAANQFRIQSGTLNSHAEAAIFLTSASANNATAPYMELDAVGGLIQANTNNLTLIGTNATITTNFINGNGSSNTLFFQAGNANMTSGGVLNAAGLQVSGSAVIHAGNIGSQSVNFATSSGSTSSAPGYMPTSGGFFGGIIGYNFTPGTTGSSQAGFGLGQLLIYSSSRRWKNDIIEIGDDVSEKIYQLRPVKWHSRLHDGDLGGVDNPNVYHAGFIAEEAHEIDEIFSTIGIDGLPESIAWGALNAAHLAETQKLHAELTDLKKMFNEYKARVEALEQ